VRRRPEGADEVSWDPEQGVPDPQPLEGVDAIVHLAGEPIAAGRWTRARKQRIRSSRIAATRQLVASLAGLDQPPRALLSASAVGFYGDRGDAQLTEESPTGEGFLAQVCREWEEAAAGASQRGARVVCLRFGVVLSPAGGALARMLPAFRAGAGGVLGSGNQYLSWISLDDAAAAIAYVLSDEDLHGPINLTAPAPVSNRDFTAALGRTLRRPTWFSMPAAVVHGLFGEMAKETLLASSRAVPQRLLASGFRFRHPELEAALGHLLAPARG